MIVLVDTSIWSLALRKKSLTTREEHYVSELRELIAELRVAMIGQIRQELLSGISDPAKFTMLRDKLQAFDDVSPSRQDYETAAEYSNECRRRGIQGSHTDFLICAVSVARKMSIFTTDKDYLNYAVVLPVRQHSVRDDL